MVGSLAKIGVEQSRDLVLAGPIGTGKTHLAIALGMEAARRRYRVAFVRASELVRDLVEAKNDRILGRLHHRYLNVALLIVDELGFTPFDRHEGELLFNLLAESLWQGVTGPPQSGQVSRGGCCTRSVISGFFLRPLPGCPCLRPRFLSFFFGWFLVGRDHPGRCADFFVFIRRQDLLESECLFENEKDDRFRVFPDERANRLFGQFPDALQNFLEKSLSSFFVSIYTT